MSLELGNTPVHKLSYRNLSEKSQELQERLFGFLDSESDSTRIRSFRDEYPSVFRSCPGGESLYLEKDGQIISHVAMLDREFQHTDFRMKIGMIGSVVTHPEQRGKGYASYLIRQACFELKKRGCLIAVLWSDQPDFYRPLGFYRAGREQDLRFSHRLVRNTKESVRPMDFNQDAHFIWRLYQKQTSRLDRSLEEQKKLLKIPNTQVYVTEQEGKITSYIAINKGADFTGFIHEWGGEISEVQRNIAHCQSQYFTEQPLTLIAPYDLDLAPLKRMAEEKWDGVLGLIKVLDKNLLLSTYMNFLKNKKIEHVWSRNKDSILFSESEFSLQNEMDIIQLVFGDEVRHAHPRLPFFLWGFDSI
jgi:GNAT superfamily N-acetyltransferase